MDPTESVRGGDGTVSLWGAAPISSDYPDGLTCGVRVLTVFPSPPPRERYKNPGHEVVGPDVITALHDDLVDHAGSSCLSFSNACSSEARRRAALSSARRSSVGRDWARSHSASSRPRSVSRDTISRWSAETRWRQASSGSLSDSNAVRYRSIEARLRSIALATRWRSFVRHGGSPLPGAHGRVSSPPGGSVARSSSIALTRPAETVFPFRS
jgi:hypothetical protein